MISNNADRRRHRLADRFRDITVARDLEIINLSCVEALDPQRCELFQALTHSLEQSRCFADGFGSESLANDRRVKGASLCVGSAMAEDLDKIDISALIERYRQSDMTVAVIGLGYVGLPLAVAAADTGFDVLGLDVDEARCEQIRNGVTSIGSVNLRSMQTHVRSGKLRPVSDFSLLSEADAVVVCVPTPITAQREPDLSHVVAASEAIVAALKPHQLIVLESTTWPGTTIEVMRPILERNGMRSGRDFYLAFSPEREDPGNPTYGTRTIPKVIGGDGDEALEIASALYERIVSSVVRVSSTQTAEAVKLTENIFRSVNIALVNELKAVFHQMNIDIWEVIEAAKTKPFGYMPFYPGPGLGGHCIPIDPFYLTWKAREFDLATHFIELAGQINSGMPRYVIQRLAEEVDARLSKGLKGTRVLIIGMAYKRNLEDCRESPALKILELLEERGAVVSYHDPHVHSIRAGSRGQYSAYRSQEWSAQMIRDHDVALIVTDHEIIDYASLIEHSRLVVDTRNACGSRGIFSPKVVKA